VYYPPPPKHLENMGENCEMIWKIWKKSKLKCEMIWKIWKKGKLNSEKIWKKGKSKCEKIWKIQKKIVKRYGKYRRKVS
jgi:hypothetical protein